MFSRAQLLLLKHSKVSLEVLKEHLSPHHEARCRVSFWRRPGFTAALVSAAPGELPEPYRAASQLAKALRCEVAAIEATTGSVTELLINLWGPTGDCEWGMEAPTRANAETRALEKQLGQRFLTPSQLERLEDRDDPAADDALQLVQAPYWNLHLGLGLPGKRPHFELTLKPALEVVGPGWKLLETWMPPLTAEEQGKASAQAAAWVKRERVVSAAIDKALASLAKQVPPKDAVGVWTSTFPTTITVASRARQAALLRRFSKRSLLLRKSRLAQQHALRTHKDGCVSVVLKDVTADEFSKVMSAAAVRKVFGDVPFGGQELRAAWGAAFARQDDNAAAALAELKPAELVQVLREAGDWELCELFDRQVVPQATELIRADVATYVPWIAEGMAQFPEDCSELETVSWVFLERAAKKAAKDARYVKALKALHAANPMARWRQALALVGVKAA